MRDSCKLRHPITVAANHSFSVHGVKNMNPLMELQGPIPLQKLMAREPHAWEIEAIHPCQHKWSPSEPFQRLQ